MPVTIIPDTGANNIYVNANTGAALILTTGPNVLVPNHNALDGKQGGQSNQYYHLTAEEYSFLVTGDVLRPIDSGLFYPVSNPSGFITGIDLSSYSTIVFVTGISGSLQSQIDETNSHSGDYYLASNPSGFITGVDLSDYVTGDVIRPEDTGNFYPASNPSGFISGVDLSSYSSISFVTGLSGDLQGQINILNSQSGDYLLASDSGLFYGSNNPSGYVTGVDLSSYATISELTGASGVLDFRIGALENSTGDYYLNSNPSGFITGVDLSAYVTGDVVRPEDTGNFYTIDNPSGYITGVDLSSYATIDFTTGISGELDSRLDTLEVNTGNYYPYSNPSGFITGDVIRPSDTGAFYPTSNPSGFAPSGSLGSLAYQNSGSVSITGGTITGLSSIAVTGLAAVGGNFTVDTNVLHVDSVNDRVGIGTTTPAAKLDVNGTANVTGNATIGGTLETTGKLTANGQPALSALGDNDVLTKKLGNTLYPNMFGQKSKLISTVDGFTGAAGTGGSASATVNVFTVFTGMTIGNVASIRTAGYSPYHYTYPNAPYNQGVDWTKPLSLSFRLAWAYGSNEGISTDVVAYVSFPRLRTLDLFQDLTTHGIGIKIQNSGIYGQAHDGTSLSQTASEIYSLIGWPYRTVDIQIVSDGVGNIGFFVNGSLIDTLIAGPSTLAPYSADSYTSFYMGVGGTTAAKSFGIQIYNGALFSYLD